jgi:dipeptidyl-peptidase-4
MNAITRTLLAISLALPVVPLARAEKPAVKPLDASYLRDHAATRAFMLGRPVKAKPTPDGKAVLFLRAEARVPKMKLYEFDVATKKTRELLSPETLLKGAEEHLTPEEKARRERQRVSVGGFTDFQLSDDGRLVLVSLSGRLYILARTTEKVRELATGKGTLIDPKFSPDGTQVGYVLDHDVYAYDLAADKERRVTTGGTEKKSHGLAEFVAQEEMGRHSGWWWSPDGTHIAYTEADADGVEVWYVADPIKPESPPQPQFYPRPGKKNVSVRLGVVPVGGGETVWVKWDRAKWEYLAAVRWDAKGPLTVQLQDRRQQTLALMLVDPKTGEAKELHRDESKAWVNIDQGLPRWLAADRMLFAPEEGTLAVGAVRDSRLSDTRPVVEKGFRHLIAANEKAVVFEAGEDPGSNTIDYAPIDHPGGSPKLGSLATGPGLHSATFSNDLSVYALTTTTPEAMPKTVVYRREANKFVEIGELPSVAEEPPFTPRVKFEYLGEGDGFRMAVIGPHDFDPKKSYPVIVDVYGGPKHLTVVQAMRNWLLDQWLADQGFVVVAVENRGTPNRGDAWEKAVYTKFGSVPLDDQVAGLKLLGEKYPFLDLDRVGIVGWSFGGYMSALAVLKRPDVFKAAVAGAPVTDWEDYDTHVRLVG